MKNLLTLVAMVALLLPSFVQSADFAYREEFLLTGGTNKVNAASVSRPLKVLDLRGNDNVAIQVKYVSTDTNLYPLYLRFEQSLDGSNWDTNAFRLVTTPAVGTTVGTCVTNFVCPGVGWWRLAWISNVNDVSVITNLAVSYSVKR